MILWVSSLRFLQIQGYEKRNKTLNNSYPGNYQVIFEERCQEALHID